MKTRYWISWAQLSEDYRPLQDPPQPENIKAWWCSGQTMNAALLCAIVDAESEESAQQAVKTAWDSGKDDIGELRSDIGGWRFIEKREKAWLPGDRFPITKDWEKERLGINKKESSVFSKKNEKRN